jgi:hypothetical protein
MTTGSTPQELDQDGKAAAELEALFRFSFELANNGNEDVENHIASSGA